MSLTDASSPVVDGIWFRPVVLTPDALSTSGSATIPATCKVAQVGAVANNANDWITLPALATVPNGHEITILCDAGTAFELRTPAASTEKINNVDCDGTQEYLCTDEEVIKIIKRNNTDGWMAHAYSKLGAVVTAVVPD